VPRVMQSVQLADDVIRDAVKWYQDNPIPQAFRDLHPAVLRTVTRISGGDWQRCVRNEDGSVTVHNTRRWTRTTE